MNTLRGLAALNVVISHFSNTSGLWGGALGRWAGQIGVMLFFVLSGFLMTYLYWSEEATPENLMLYAGSRAARILPLYLLVVFASFLTPFMYNIENVHVLVSHLLFLHGNSVLWTIPPEIQFYVLFGVTWWLASHHRAMLPFVIFFALTAPFFADFRNGTRELLGFPITASLITAIPYFTVGSVLGGLYKYREYLAAYQSRWYVWALVLLPVLYPTIFAALFGFQDEMWKDMGILVTVAVVFFCIVFLVPDGNALLENRVGDFYGKISYSLYLLHLPILVLLNHIGWAKPGLGWLLFFVAIASFMAWLSFTFIESPARRAVRAMVANYVSHVSARPAHVADQP